MYKVTLESGERLLNKQSATFAEGKVADKMGVCFMTDRRLIFQYQPVWIAVSMLTRPLALLVPAWRKQSREIRYRELVGIGFEKYGVNQSAVVIPFPDGTVLWMLLSAYQRDKWVEALDDVLREQGLQRVPEGENRWRIRPLS